MDHEPQPNSIDEQASTVCVEQRSQAKREEKQRDERNRRLEADLSGKKFIDFRKLELVLPANKPDTGYNHRNWKNIESQIINFLSQHKLYKLGVNDLDGYLGLLVGRYPQLYEEKYHGWKHIKASIQNSLRYIRSSAKNRGEDLTVDDADGSLREDERVNSNSATIGQLQAQVQELQSRLALISNAQSFSQSQPDASPQSTEQQTQQQADLSSTGTVVDQSVLRANDTAASRQSQPHASPQSTEQQTQQQADLSSTGTVVDQSVLRANDTAASRQDASTGGNAVNLQPLANATISQTTVLQPSRDAVQVISTNDALHAIGFQTRTLIDATNAQNETVNQPPKRGRGRPRKDASLQNENRNKQTKRRKT